MRSSHDELAMLLQAAYRIGNNAGRPHNSDAEHVEGGIGNLFVAAHISGRGGTNGYNTVFLLTLFIIPVHMFNFPNLTMEEVGKPLIDDRDQ